MGHWVCEVCKEEITPTDDGAILVFNTNPEYGEVGSHPVGPTVNPPEPEFMQLGSKESWDYLEAARNAVSIGFSVAHTRCKDSPEGPYFIEPERARWRHGQVGFRTSGVKRGWGRTMYCGCWGSGGRTKERVRRSTKRPPNLCRSGTDYRPIS